MIALCQVWLIYVNVGDKRVHSAFAVRDSMPLTFHSDV